MSKDDPPAPPNPYQVAGAQTGTNVATSVANAFLNNTSQVTPQGSLDYNVTGNYSWTDPSTGQSYTIPRFTATQTLSPTQQAIQAQNEAAQYNLAGMGNAQSGRIAQFLATPFDPTNLPQGGDPSSITGVPGASTSFDRGGQLVTDIGQTGDIRTSYSPEGNYSADRQRVEDALMARMNPQLALERQGIEQRLADQGIRYGSDAYTRAMDDYNRQANDARFAAIGQAGQEQARLNAMTAQEAAFQNAAQQQGFDQATGRANFTNQAMGAIFNQNAALESFRNAGLAQQIAQAQSGYNANQSARNQALQEAFAMRNQPINEITSLLSGSQVSQPNFLNTPQSQIPTTDIGGMVQQNFQNQMGVYNQQQQQMNQIIGGVLGIGAGAARGYFSDERLKENIDKIGTVFSAKRKGKGKAKLPIYEYQYKGDPSATRHVGPMAQDVEKIDPGAVGRVGGYRTIDPDRVMGNILRAA